MRCQFSRMHIAYLVICNLGRVALMMSLPLWQVVHYGQMEMYSSYTSILSLSATGQLNGDLVLTTHNRLVLIFCTGLVGLPWLVVPLSKRLGSPV